MDALKLKYLEIIYIKLNQKFKTKIENLEKNTLNVKLEKLFIKFKNYIKK